MQLLGSGAIIRPDEDRRRRERLKDLHLRGYESSNPGVPQALVTTTLAGAPPAAPDGHPELWARLRELPHKQRTAVFCRSVLGMPYDELAVLLESSEDAARRNVHEGLRRLKEEMT